MASRADGCACCHRHADVGGRSTSRAHQPGLYYGLVLTLDRALRLIHRLNFFHGFSLGAQPHPAFFLIKLWAARGGPASTQFFVYTMAGSWPLLSFLAIFLSTNSMDFGQLRIWPRMQSSADGRGASGAGDAVLAIGVLAGSQLRCADPVPHVAAAA